MFKTSLTKLLSAGALATVLGLGLMTAPDAHAQGMNGNGLQLLTQSERDYYLGQLAGATDSATRARVQAEMNRLIQERRLQGGRGAQNNDNENDSPFGKFGRGNRDSGGRGGGDDGGDD